MKIEILGWKCKGLRAADMEINLRPNNSTSKVSLILLDSGGGKTTVCELIRHTLSGGILHLEKEEIMSYARPANSKYRSENGRFELSVSFDNSIHTFEVLFDFLNKSIDVNTTTADRGHKPGYKFPSAASEFLKKNFVNLYIYDGEQAKNILNEKSNVADLTVETINQLGYFDDIKKSLDVYFKNLKEESAGTKAAKSQVTRLSNKIAAFRERKEELQKVMKGKNSDLVEIGKNLKLLNQEKKDIDKASQDAQKRLKDTELLIQSDAAIINETLKSILDKLKQPHHISKDIELAYVKFRDNLEKQKIPEHSSSAFFTEVAESDTCICDLPITPNMRKSILNNAKKYMGSSYTSFFDHMKADVRHFILNSEEKNSQKILEVLEANLKDKQKALHISIQDSENIKKSIKTSGGRTVDQIDADIADLNKKEAAIILFIENYQKFDPNVSENTNPAHINSDMTLDAIIKDLKNQEALTQNLVNITNKIEDINNLIDQCKKTAKKNIKENLKFNMNEKLANIITQDSIKIEEMGDSIKLEYIERGSEGQNLALAYIFLTVALNQARESNQLPLLVDSPAGKIGQAIRENLAVMVPNNTSQFICLIQLGERQWFAEKLREHAGKNPSFYTVFLKSKETQHYLDEKIKGLVEHENSAVVSGFDFLSSFSIPGSAGVNNV
jgi:DNA sulfur modification protein DndD